MLLFLALVFHCENLTEYHRVHFIEPSFFELYLLPLAEVLPHPDTMHGSSATGQREGREMVLT